ncbi:MAG: DUF58 domain-containing protein [Chthoniobacterales bacterium]
MPAQPPPLPHFSAAVRGTRRPPPLPNEVPLQSLPPLDLKLLAELPTLELQARYMMQGFLSGKHRSPQKGSSVEFAEYRDYQLGDDLRRVDWRLYGRTDRLHIKQYEEETQLRVFLVLDTSGSMDFSTQPGLLRKVEYARIVLAAIGLLAQRQGDAFGLGLAGTELSDFMRARSSVPHWRSFVGRLEVVKTGGKTALAKSLEDLAEVIPARSMVVIASDFYEEPALLAAALRRLRYDHHETIGLHVLDPQEVDFDFTAGGKFTDAETGAELKLDAPSVRKGYLERFGAFCTDLDELFRGVGGETCRLRTDRTPIDALASYLAQRRPRR